MAFRLLDDLLGTRTKVRLLRVLVPLNRPVSGREAARLAGVSRMALRTLEELSTSGILERGEVTGQHLFTFNGRHQLAGAVEHLFDAERRFTSTLFSRLGEEIAASGPVEGAMLFGSSARGDASPGSDLDVLVIVRKQSTREEVHSALADAATGLETEFGVSLSPVVITLRQLRRQHRENDPFIEEVRRDARHIMGRTVEELIGGTSLSSASGLH